MKIKDSPGYKEALENGFEFASITLNGQRALYKKGGVYLTVTRGYNNQLTYFLSRTIDRIECTPGELDSPRTIGYYTSALERLIIYNGQK